MSGKTYNGGVNRTLHEAWQELVDIAAEIRNENDRAWFVYDGSIRVWLPKRLVEYDADDGVFTMPYWLAYEKGLI